MAPLNKQDESYLEQKENMSTLQAEPDPASSFMHERAEPAGVPGRPTRKHGVFR
jgi:hypothetical protein